MKQTGFRTGFPFGDQCITLHYLCTQDAPRGALYTTFKDLKAALDSILHERLWKKLAASFNFHWLLQLLMRLHEYTTVFPQKLDSTGK